MAGRTTRGHFAATPRTLNSATRDRIHRLVMRAMHHRSGAEAALRAAVVTGVAEMVAAGASLQAARHAIAECVVSHPDSLPDKRSLLTGESRASVVLTHMLGWAGDVTPPPVASSLALSAPTQRSYG